MKSYFICLVVSAVFTSYVECDLEKAKAAILECKEEVGATDEDFNGLINHEPAGTPEAKCLHACAMKKFGLMNDDGKFDKEKAIEILKIVKSDDEEQQNLGIEILDVCADIDVNEDHCEAAEEYRACMHAKAAENGFVLVRI